MDYTPGAGPTTITDTIDGYTFTRTVTNGASTSLTALTTVTDTLNGTVTRTVTNGDHTSVDCTPGTGPVTITDTIYGNTFTRTVINNYIVIEVVNNRTVPFTFTGIATITFGVPCPPTPTPSGCCYIVGNFCGFKFPSSCNLTVDTIYDCKNLGADPVLNTMYPTGRCNSGTVTGNIYTVNIGNNTVVGLLYSSKDTSGDAYNAVDRRGAEFKARSFDDKAFLNTGQLINRENELGNTWSEEYCCCWRIPEQLLHFDLFGSIGLCLNL
ncbi:hypothetical protein BGW38_010788 [Lunasporangiospora selenospora]|uniref:Uncharacterized protein n=1 Tax=Lunasporangiospora selenospora TaxID=979761 RepID=A0A9P6FVR6_9FUNG|nr:hypothetical protein BGW38_010788 [Lunasporangiospora selenospora]